MSRSIPSSANRPAANRPKARQLSFDYMLGTRRQFRINEVAAIIGMSARFAEDLFDAGQLSGHEHNAGKGLRKSKTVLREWIQAYLLKTAKYDSAMRLQMATEILDTFSPEDLLELRTHITKRLSSSV